MLVGLAVRYFSDPGAHLVNKETVCSCDGLNITPHILTINVTSHSYCFRRTRKVNDRCPPVSTPYMVTMVIKFLLAPLMLQRWVFSVERCCSEYLWKHLLQRLHDRYCRESTRRCCLIQSVSFCLWYCFIFSNTCLYILSFDHICTLSPVCAAYLHQQCPLMLLTYWFSSELLARSVCY